MLHPHETIALLSRGKLTSLTSCHALRDIYRLSRMPGGVTAAQALRLVHLLPTTREVMLGGQERFLVGILLVDPVLILQSRGRLLFVPSIAFPGKILSTRISTSTL